ncbi:MAG: hypothetical protein LBT05_03990 [Planctomycetaceae bacterium]|nr:hypothetical protein [Planctomycetaceae bacterium]
MNKNGASTFEPAYTAIMLIPTPGGFNSNVSSNILQYLQSQFPSVITADNIDENRPGAVFEDEQWILVEDFVKNKAKK